MYSDAQESRSQLFSDCVCATFFTRRRNVLFLFQSKFHVLGVHTRLFQSRSRYFTFAFSVFISLRLYTKRSETIFVYFLEICSSSQHFMTYQFISNVFGFGLICEGLRTKSSDDKWLCHWAWEVSLRCNVINVHCLLIRIGFMRIVKWQES